MKRAADMLSYTDHYTEGGTAAKLPFAGVLLDMGINYGFIFLGSLFRCESWQSHSSAKQTTTQSSSSIRTWRPGNNGHKTTRVCVCVRGNDGTCHQCNTNVFRIVFVFVTKMGLCGTEDEDSRLRYPHCRFGSAH